MSESTLKPFTGKLDENVDTKQPQALKPFTGALDDEGKGVIGHLKDTGLSALKGAIAVPELAVGVMDMMSDGAVGKTLENQDGAIGFRPKEAKQTLSNLHTDQYKAQQQEFSDAGKDGNWVDKVVDKTKVALSNPALITNTVVESVPSMLAGGVLGRASGIANPVVAGAVGEGAVMAGSQAEQIRQETVDGRLTADQSLAGVTTGALGGLIGFAGGRLAQKMGIGDVDTMLVTGRAGTAEIAGEIASMPAKSLPRRMVEGAISEGFLEELPQSVSEQILQNLALDKPWSNGIEDAAVMGTLAGMAMGGGANILSGHNAENEPQINQSESNIPNLPSAPSQLSTSQDGALTGEYIPRVDPSQGSTNQSQTAFVYDQPSMEADNLLDNNYSGDTDFNTSGNFDPSNNPDSPLSPSGGNYFDDTQTQLQLPSERLGINPNDGPMSSAAALAVDSGASPVAHEQSQSTTLSSAQDLHPQQEGNTPLRDAVPSNYQSLLDSQTGQSQIDYLEQQFADAKSVPKKAEIRKQIDELKTNNLVTENQTKPAFKADANLSVGSLPWSKDIASQALRQYQGDANSLAQKNQSLTGSGAATDLIYYKNSPSFSNVEVVDGGDKSIVKLTNAKTGQVIEREYPKELSRFNQFLNGAAINSQQENISADITTASAVESPNTQRTDSTEGVEVQSGSTSSGQNTSVIPVSAQISKLEQQFEAAKTVPQKAKLRKQIDQLKLHQNTEATTQWQSMSPEQRQAIVQQIDTSNVPYANRLPNTQWDKIADSVKARLVGVMGQPTDQIDSNAHEAATSPQNDLPAPTQAQIEAGNYKKGHIKVQGLDIAVENPRGSTRSGKRPDGTEWEHAMSDHYGYIKRTRGADSEHIDTYVGNNPDSNQVFIVDQVDQETGNFDEHKVMLGFNSQEEATTAYKSNFDKGWKVGPIRTMDMEQFKNWLKNEDTSKPANEIKADSLITQGANVNAKSEQGLNTYTQIQSDSGLTHIIPSILMDQVHKLGSVVNDISSIKTEGVKTNVLYGKQLLAQIAKLKPDVQVHIVSDLNSIKDNTIRANLNAGGFFVPEQNTAYLYPQSRAWESSALELLNHELVHAVTEQSIFAGQVSQSNLNKLNEIIDNIKEYAFENYASLTEHVNDRLDYATTTNPTHEILAVGISETQVRQVLQNILGADGLQQLNSIFTEISTEQENQNEQRKQNGNPREHSKGNTKNVSEPTDGITEEVSGGTTSTETDRNFKRNTSNPSGNLSGNESSQYPFTLNKTIQDFGEKIGGARKDTAVKTGKKSTASKEKDDRPTWAKRYEISEIIASINSEEKGKWIISDTRKKDWKGQNRIVTKQQFNTKEEAEAALPLIAVAQKHRVWSAGKETFAIYREINDRKRVKVVEQEFKTREEAMQYMAIHASEILETNTTFGEIDLPRPENTQRKGIARRTDDAKDSDFTKVFGFRGVEFGNWNNQIERQELLNDAFDGLMDLAEVLNIPPEAISLNGELALAFGARGHGLSGAAAHYEPERVVINLTKMNGAGSLAHEWWHALDHYFGRQDGKASSVWMTNTDGSRSLKIQKRFEDMTATSGFSRQSNVREDVQNAYNELVKTIFKKSETYVEDTIRVESFVSGARENLKSKLDLLRNDLNRDLDPKYYKRFNKAASAEQLAEFDTVVELLLTGTMLSTELRYSQNTRNIFSGARWTNDALETLSAIYKAVRGRSGFNAEQKGILDQIRQYMNTFSSRLKMLAEAQQGTVKAKIIPTNFAMNAKELDQGRGTDYWITTHEMTARAFQGYVEDKIAELSAYSPFLNYGPESAAILTPWGFKRPYPIGDERVQINKSFEKLIENFKTEKTDQGTKLFSRASKGVESSTIAQIREVLVNHFGEKTINELERQGKLEIIQDYAVDGVEGFYYNGKAVLIASNLTPESAVPTFLHELGGHAGFQNMMNQEQYKELMRQFDKLVEQGNPVAMAAKLLADREQGSVRQQLEYLPYLLTLSSTMQQRNVIQSNALQKLIRNIVAYVKAWAFDRFGINLNLNPDDILALSERMIKQIERQTSMDTVRQKYQGTSQWMTAPNGAKTRLTEQQWLQVRTPEFKNWFGDWENDAVNASQVLDENGEPKVVYHGTSTEFNEFRKGHGLLGDGIYLTDSFDTADMYANVRGENGFVLPLFVNIRNAFKTTGNVSRDKVVEATRSGKYQGVVHHFDNHEYIVALESNQVKMAEGNTGTFNSESADIRFSRSAKDIIDKLGKDLKGTTVQSIKDKTGYKFTDWLGISLSALGRRQLTEIYSKILPQLNNYNELAAQMDADKNDAGAEADSIVREWANLKDEEQLAELMHDATLAMIDPAKLYKSGDNKAKYQQLLHAYNNLTPEAQAMYKNARDAYKKHYTKVHQAIKERIMRAELSSEKKADLMKQMDDNFFNGRIKGVYFPLARFGKYVVLMHNQNGQIESVSRAETMAEAQRLRSELMQKYPHFKVDRVILDKEFNASRDGVGRGFMTSLFAEVDNLGLSTAEQAEFEDTLSQLYLSSMPDLSWAKHGIHRKGTAGFSQDARRAFAQNMFHGAGYLAKLRYGDQLAQQLDDMQKYASEQSKLNESYDQPTAQRVIDEMNKRHDNLMNPKSHPLSSALTSLGFIYYLGLSPASALVNLSQTALVAYPIMGAKWDFDKAAQELLKASNDFRKGVEFHKVKWEGTKTDLYKTMSADISKFLSKDEKQAYDDAVARGVIDVTQAHDLAGIAQGEDSGVMWKTRPIMRAASVMFHHAERFNREVTFIAAYRLARKAGSNHESAFDQAVDVTYKGHFDYSSGNRPRIMQGNVAKVLLLFKQFGQNMIYTLARQTYQSIKAETNAERKEARKTLGAILAMHAAFAGTLGLPMVGMLLSVASWMGGDDDDPWDAEVALRNYLAEAFGPTISTLLMKGAPRALTPLDMSGRVGINNLLLPDVQEGLEGKRWAESAMAGALGPVAGIGLNVAKGAQEISEGHNLRGVETMLPVFLKNFAKTYRFGEEGVQDKTGVSIMDEVGSMDLLVQGMGFSPSDVRTANEGKSAIYQLDKKLNERRGRLMALWSRAKLMDDQNEMDEIWEEIQGFNERNPSRRITRVNLNQSYKNRQRRIDRAEDGIYLSRNRQDARSAGYFAFGE